MTTTHTHRSLTVRSSRLMPVLEATALALVIWAVAWLTHGDLLVRANGSTQTIGSASVIIVALLAGFAAWGSLSLFHRLGRPVRQWKVLANAVLALSLLGPLTEGVGAGTKISLIALHLGVGVVLILGLGRAAQSSR